MTIHYWGDKSVDWKGINEAAQYIETYCRKWGRINCHAKEKFGTVRAYVDFGHFTIHSLMYPGLWWSRFPRWLWNLDVDYFSSFLNVLSWPLIRYQKWVYNRAYQNALKKWPHLRAEILTDADYLELIKGASVREGFKTIVLGWNGETITTWVSPSSADEEHDASS